MAYGVWNDWKSRKRMVRKQELIAYGLGHKRSGASGLCYQQYAISHKLLTACGRSVGFLKVWLAQNADDIDAGPGPFEHHPIVACS